MFEIINFAFSLFFLMFLIAMMVTGFFLFDSSILNGYFKKKLQKRFNVNDV